MISRERLGSRFPVGNGHALLLPAGELAGIAVRLLIQPHQLEDIGNAPLQVPAGGPDGPHGEGQIFVHSFLVNQAEILKDDPQRPAHQGHLAGADIVQTVPVDHQLSLGQGDLAGDQLDDGGLSRPGWTHQKDKFPVIDTQINPLQGLGSVIILFINIDKSYHVCISSPVSFFLRCTGSTAAPSRISPEICLVLGYTRNLSLSMEICGFMSPFFAAGREGRRQ